MMSNRNHPPARYDSRSVWWVLLACAFSILLPLTTRSQIMPLAPNLIPGQSATKLGDGRLLLIGGESAGGGLNTAATGMAQCDGFAGRSDIGSRRSR